MKLQCIFCANLICLHKIFGLYVFCYVRKKAVFTLYIAKTTHLAVFHKDAVSVYPLLFVFFSKTPLRKSICTGRM